MYRIKILLIIVISLFSSIVANAQNCRISGKLNMINSKKVDLPKKIYAFLKSKNIQDSVLLNQKFEFEFNKLPIDTFNLSFSIRSYPRNTYYILKPKENENYKFEIKFNSACPYSKSKRKQRCLICRKKDQVIPIVYGFLSKVTYKNKDGQEVDRKGKRIDPKKNRSYPGGCIISDCQPNWYCQRDETEF